jgi:hypothetical protein
MWRDFSSCEPYDSQVKNLRHIILPVLGCLLVGCGSPASQTIEETIEQTYQIEPTASVSISNVDGSIFLYGAESTEVSLQATKRAYSQERLNKIAINVSARPDSFSIETNFPPKPTWGLFDRSGAVDYVIVIPQTAKISRLELANGEVSVEGMRGEGANARLGRGWLSANNCFCNLHLAVGNGRLEMIYDWWEPGKFSVDAKIADGHARALLPSSASFHLLAEAAKGKIANDFAAQQQRNSSALNKIDMIIGPAPEAEIDIQATEGNITITEVYP